MMHYKYSNSKFYTVLIFLLAVLTTVKAQDQQNKLPDTLYFAGQRVPLEYLDVKERLYQIFYPLIYEKRGKVNHWLGKAGMFIPRIKQQLAIEGVHQDFAYITVAESELNHRIVSPAKAAGLWQFIEPTAKRFNLRLDKQCDERNLLDKSSSAAARYIYHLQNSVFNTDPFLAMAAYNNGEGNVLKMLKAQNVNSFWDAISNTETSDYVCRVIVYKELLSNPGRYGFSAVSYNDYLSNTEYFALEKLEKKIAYSTIADYLNISYREFYMINPHIFHLGYNKGGFFDKKTSINLVIPNGKTQSLIDSLAASGYLLKSIQNIAEMPVEKEANSLALVAKKNDTKAYLWHTVKEKTLGEIAFKYKKDWQRIAADNNLKIIELNGGVKVAEIRKGQKIKIYKD